MERQYCGQLTNKVKACQRLCRVGYDSCGYHKSIDEVPIENNKRKRKTSHDEIIGLKQDKSKKINNKLRGPKKDTISYKIGLCILETKTSNKWITKNAIKKYMMINHHILNVKMINILMKRMTDKGLLFQKKQSFNLSPEFRHHLIKDYYNI